MSFLHSELDDFVALLDQRYDAKVKITMAKKVRKLGFPSKLYPPTGAPDFMGRFCFLIMGKCSAQGPHTAFTVFQSVGAILF